MKKYLLLLVGIIFVTGCGNKLDKIKNGSISECDDYTVEELVDNYVKDATWTKVNDNTYKVKGMVSYNNDYQKITLEFSGSKEVKLEKGKLENDDIKKKDLAKYICKVTRLKKEGFVKVVSDIPVVAYYNDEAYVLEGLPKTMDVTLYGLKKDINEYEIEDLSVTVDFDEDKIGEEQTAYYRVVANNDIIGEVDTPTVEVKLSKKVSKKIGLDYEFENKKSEVNVKYLDTVEVIVKGPKEAVHNIDRVVAIYDLKGKIIEGRSTIYTRKIIAYDKDNKEIDNVEIVPSTVSIVIEG